MAPKILGLGYSVPQEIRTNDDPIFDWLKKHYPDGLNLFTGYIDRRVLAEGEDLMTIMVPAAQQAIANAGLEAHDIDLLLGIGSVSHFLVPDELCHLHHKLNLKKDVWVIPLGNSFSHYHAGLLFADAMVRCGRCKNVLICVASNWTRFVDYHTPQAVSAADGAGAAVVGVSDNDSLWEVTGTHTVTWSQYYGSMYMGPDEYAPPEYHSKIYTAPYFHITPKGLDGFKEFGEVIPPKAALELLGKHSVSPQEVTVISHQASSVLLDAWQKAINPAQYIWTIEQFANMAPANVPVTLAWATDNQPISQDNLLLLGIGPEMHTNALLLRRSTPGTKP